MTGVQTCALPISSYAKSGTGKETIAPIASNMGLNQYVTENPDRIPYFESLQKLTEADLLIIPGSSDPNYTASKLYPYILAKKPILAVFSASSSVINVLKVTNAGNFITFDASKLDFEAKAMELFPIFEKMLQNLPFTPLSNWQAFQPYTALEMTKKQVYFFEKVLSLS